MKEAQNPQGQMKMSAVFRDKGHTGLEAAGDRLIKSPYINFHGFTGMERLKDRGKPDKTCPRLKQWPTKCHKHVSEDVRRL